MPVLRHSLTGPTPIHWSLSAAGDDVGLRRCRPHLAGGCDDDAVSCAMKSAIGLVLAFAIGFVCRAFAIPSPAPPAILGALLVMAMTVGYTAVDRWMARPARNAINCGGPSGSDLNR
jgi:XapX domain-containing protein